VTAGLCLHRGTAHEIGMVTRLLDSAGLPVEDLTTQHMAAFIIATRGDATLGIIGLEKFADVGLLRSLVVDPAHRGKGFGRQLVDALESTAAADGIRELWLLTVDAGRFFNNLAYVAISRDKVPAVLQATPEFLSLCPGDAVVMHKKL